jgi:SAM-dependent methyltransferase
MNTFDTSWKKWGQADPYYAVLTSEKYRGENLAPNVAEFFASGQDYISDLLEHLHRLYDGMTNGTALDFGCGVGRLLIPLALRYERTIGVDISEGMLQEAAINFEKYGLSNATFVVSNDSLSQVRGNVDLVHSMIVLQHIPVPRGMQIMEKLLNLLNPGGIAALHVPISPPSLVRNALNLATSHVPGLSTLTNVVRGRRPGDPFMLMNSYDPEAVFRLFRRCGMTNIFIQPRADARFSGIFTGQKTPPAVENLISLPQFAQVPAV